MKEILCIFLSNKFYNPNTMKKNLFVLAFLFLSCMVYSQAYVPTPEDIERLFNTKTLVVLDINPLNTFDIEIKEAMQNEWTITEYDFIPFSEFDEKRKNPDYSFLFIANVNFEKDKMQATYKFLNLSLGGKYANINQMPDLVSVPVAYKSVEEDSYNYKLGILVRFIQNHIKLLREHPELAGENVFKHYNENMGSVQGKTLYLIEKELAKDIRSQAKVKAIYPNKFKFVSPEDIKEAIKNRDESVVFLHKVGPEGTRMTARCYKVLIGAGDANFYYFNFHNITSKKPDGLLKSDLKKLK
jgi:hypothetical protein